MISYDGMDDFVLYPGQEAYTNMQVSQQEDQGNLYVRSQYGMDGQFAELAMSTYDTAASLAAFSAPTTLYDAPHFVVDAPPESLKHGTCRYTPPGSPSNSATHSFDHPPSTMSSTSGASVPSANSSAVGSPYSRAMHVASSREPWSEIGHGLGFGPGIVSHDAFYAGDYVTRGLEHEVIFAQDKLPSNFVDPSLIQPFQTPVVDNATTAPYAAVTHAFHTPSQMFQPPSPAPSNSSAQSQSRQGSANLKARSQSPYHHASSFHPYQHPSTSRRLSISSEHSRYSLNSQRSSSFEIDDENNEKGRCPHPDCGRVFKDLKAHMLTHQLERPEKCPIVTCEYHQKGFARKYDKNRHTLTHYKGTMVCGFCPGSGSAAEKSFNRADVFKRHLTTVHGVEQTPPNSRKRFPSNGSSKKSTNYPPDATGKCSTCSDTFSNAQDFYEHLDDCVLRIVRQEEPSEAINERRLAEVADDPAVQETMNRHMLATQPPNPNFPEEDEDEDEDEYENDNDDTGTFAGSSRAQVRSGRGSIKTNKRNSS